MYCNPRASSEFEEKSRAPMQAKVTLFLLPPDGVC
jgi:hypothetical protein